MSLMNYLNCSSNYSSRTLTGLELRNTRSNFLGCTSQRSSSTSFSNRSRLGCRAPLLSCVPARVHLRLFCFNERSTAIQQRQIRFRNKSKKGVIAFAFQSTSKKCLLDKAPAPLNLFYKHNTARHRATLEIALPCARTRIEPCKSRDQETVEKDRELEVRPVFPFTAIVGQEEMKLALILNVIDPKIGGVMIMGDRGTGKSTTVRALVDLLPEIEVVLDDPFNSDPRDLEAMSKEVREKIKRNDSIETIKRKILMIDLPLGATEDRVCGTIDIEKALTEGVKAFEPGLLAKANRGILYVDEVNLLDDHLVDVLLDSAASGWNTVERESISISHPARFILVGSGNPEEGELRPQLLDRFGMHAQIGTVKEPHLRVKIVEQRASFDEAPTILRKQYSRAQEELREKIKVARELRPRVEMDYDLRMKVSEVCSLLDVDGLRGDIVTNRASQAIAAFEERDKVTVEDIFRVVPLCLRHRLRKDPLESIDSGDRVKDVFKKVFGL